MSDNVKKISTDTLEIIEIHLQKALVLATEIDEPMIRYVISMGIHEVESKLKTKKRA
ncbi:hypothetical protein [Lentilitoribacter sp. EG35]|uniref:hypothetical protein n=1 Tax=Lentilitoribacter sp. EG35 TaxID=3234192 RepID=UPI00345F56CC